MPFDFDSGHPERRRGVRGRRWLNAAGVATWLICGLEPLTDIASGNLGGWRAVFFVVAFVLYGIALITVLYGSHHPPPPIRPPSIALVAVQSATGLAMTFLGGEATAAATLVVVAAELPYVMPASVAFLWVLVQSVLLGVIGSFMGGWIGVLAIAGSFGGFQVFAVASSCLARSEAAAREQLARVNAELVATRGMLAESSRIAERLRISRDLHDTLGHHLTALSLQLDVASRLADGKAAEHVTQAHAITRLLLGDVRDVVSRLRDSSRFDLAQGIRTLAEASDDLTIHVDMPDAIDLEDENRAQALLRCVQEIITNTTRHASARNLWLRLEPRTDGVVLHARDDGRGTEALTIGHGLTGMRERFEEHAGQIEFTTASGRGFEVRGFMPRPQAAS